jgi:carbon storage regulator CsrA
MPLHLRRAFMLVLTRNEEESITIYNENDGSILVVTVCRNDGRKVRLGIDAGKNYKITRTELIQRSNAPSQVEFFKQF